MRLALDTNILAYAEGVNGAARQQQTLQLIELLRRRHEVYIPCQTIGELFNVLTRKAGYAPPDARSTALAWLDPGLAIETSRPIIRAALDLAMRHQLCIWDAVVMAAAAEVECGALISEDLEDGFIWSGVTVVNPYAQAVHPLLASLLKHNGRS